MTLLFTNTECALEFLERIVRQRLGEDVGEHLVSWAKAEVDFFRCDAFTDEMMSDVNVFGTGMRNWMARKSDTSLVIHANERGGCLQKTEVSEECTEPDGFLRCVRGSHVLCFDSGKCDCGLFLRGPRDSAASDVENEPRNRAAVIQVLCPVGIRP